MKSCFLQDHLQESLLDAMIEEELATLNLSTEQCANTPKRSDLLRREMIRRCSFLVSIVTFAILKKHSYNKALRRDELEMKGILSLNEAGRHYIPNPNSAFETFAYKFMYLTLENYAEKIEMDAKKKEEFCENINDEDAKNLVEKEYSFRKDKMEEKRISFKILMTCFAKLNKVQIYVLVHSFALFNREKKTLKQLAEELGYSVGKVSRIMLKAKMKIKESQEEIRSSLQQLKLF